VETPKQREIPLTTMTTISPLPIQYSLFFQSPSRFMNWIQGLPLIILTPNCGLKRTERSVAVSPTSSSIRSINSQNWSPEHKLRRSASQLSNESEFSDDFLPIKIKNIVENKKISFPSVKIDKNVTKSITIQNGSDKKLSLRVKVIGAGFSVTPQEEFRMVPKEARTFHVKFAPSIASALPLFSKYETILLTVCKNALFLGFKLH